MPTYTRHLKQKATHWPVTGSNGYGGFVFGTPQLLDVRIEEKHELFLDADGNEVTSNSILYMQEKPSVGDYIIEGDFTSTPDPSDLDGARIIRNTARVTDLRALNALQKVWL